MTAFVDTAVFMYAVGGQHPLREPCRQVLRSIGGGELDATTSVEVVQEILHRFLALRRAMQGAEIATDALDLLAPVLPVTHAVLRRMPELVARYPTLTARDLLHVATCQHEGIGEIISPDRGFDAVEGLVRIDPLTFAA